MKQDARAKDLAAGWESSAVNVLAMHTASLAAYTWKHTAAKADLEHLVALAHALPRLNIGQSVPAR